MIWRWSVTFIFTPFSTDLLSVKLPMAEVLLRTICISLLVFIILGGLYNDTFRIGIGFAALEEAQTLDGSRRLAGARSGDAVNKSFRFHFADPTLEEATIGLRRMRKALYKVSWGVSYTMK